MPFNNNNFSLFGLKYNVGVDTPFSQKDIEGEALPPPPQQFISINEDNTNIIVTSGGELLTTN